MFVYLSIEESFAMIGMGLRQVTVIGWRDRWRGRREEKSWCDRPDPSTYNLESSSARLVGKGESHPNRNNLVVLGCAKGSPAWQGPETSQPERDP